MRAAPLVGQSGGPPDVAVLPVVSSARGPEAETLNALDPSALFSRLLRKYLCSTRAFVQGAVRGAALGNAICETGPMGPTHRARDSF